MIPEELFKRKHYGTPPIFSLIVTNGILVCFIVPFFATCDSLSWFFWLFIALLAVYNAYTVRRHRAELDKVAIISYVIGVIVAIAAVILLLHRNCSDSL